MGISSKIAFRFLKSNKWQTILIILGISIGVAVQIFTGILIQSLQKGLVDAVVGDSSHITVLSANQDVGLIEGYDDIVEELEKVDEIRAVSLAADQNGFTNASDETTAIFVRGFDFDKAEAIYEFEEKLTDGDFPDKANEVMIGKEFAENLDLEIDDEFYVQNAANVSQSVKITGIYDFNVKAINELWIITTIENVQDIFGLGDNVTSIETQVFEEYLFECDAISASIEKDLDDNDIVIQNWQEQNAELLSGLQSQSTSSYFIQVSVIVSVVIGIASVLAITVLQKSRQLGILKAMGITDRDASKIFLFEGLVFGIGGAIGGIALGVFLLFGFQTGTGGGVINIVFDPVFILISAVIAIGAAVLASLSPAIKSSKLDPIDIIRGE